MNPSVAWLIVVRAYVVEIVRAGWVWALFLVCILSSLATVLRSHHAYLEAADRYALELQDRQRVRFATTAGPSGRSIEPTLRVLRPPNPVSVLVAGVERTMPSGWDFGPAGAETLPPYPSQISLVSLDVLTDGESVIRLFGGLLGLALGLWLITGDQQRGWLAAGSAYPTAPCWPIAAMLAAGSVVLALVALAWVFVMAGFAQWLLGPAPELGFAFAATWCFVWAYLVTMFAVGGVIARVTVSPLGGTAVAASVWTLAVLMGPQLLSAVLFLMADIPPRARFEYERRETYADRQLVAGDALVSRLMAAVPDTPTRTEFDILAEEAFPEFEAAWLKEMGDARAEAAAASSAWLRNQQLWVGRLTTVARLNPGTLLQSALATSNGQGWSTQSWWDQAAHSHEIALNRTLFDDLPVVTLKLFWRDEPFQWAFVRHRPRSVAQLPSFDETEGASTRHRRIDWADAAAAVLQLMIALAVAALYPARPEQH